MEISKVVTVEVEGKAIVISIDYSTLNGDTPKLLNNYIDATLGFMKDFEIVKYYSNRFDTFFVMPQNGWQPVELLVQTKKLLKL